MSMLIPSLRSTKVLIVGKGPGWELTRDFLYTDYNIWAIPQSYGNLEVMAGNRVDLVFEVHDPKAWRKKRAILRRLNDLCSPPKLIVPQRFAPWTNNSYLLPVEEIRKFGLPLLNSFAWMIAYALHRGATAIALRGVNLDYANEALHERDSMMYLLGYLKSSGITLDIEFSSGLMQGNTLWQTIIS